MAGVLKPVAWGESAEELYERYRAEREVERRKRLHALWLVRRGERVDEAARQAGVGQRTVTRWLGWYRQAGLHAMLERVPGHGAVGASGRLSDEQRRRLLEQSSQGRFRTYEEARQWVGAEYGVEYSYQGMYAVLARLSVHPKVPRPTAAKADPAAREAWKKGGSSRR